MLLQVIFTLEGNIITTGGAAVSHGEAGKVPILFVPIRTDPFKNTGFDLVVGISPKAGKARSTYTILYGVGLFPPGNRTLDPTVSPCYYRVRGKTEAECRGLILDFQGILSCRRP